MGHNHKAARQYSDQYHCSHCGKQWDVNDTDPPECTIESLVKTSIPVKLSSLRPGDKFTLVRSGQHYKVVSNVYSYNVFVKFLYTGDTKQYQLNRQCEVIKHATNK